MRNGAGTTNRSDQGLAPAEKTRFTPWHLAGPGVSANVRFAVGTDGYGGTGPIRDVRVAVLRCATKHVAETWCVIGRPRLPCHRILEPLHPQLVDAHWGSADPVLVARHTDPSVRAFAKHTGNVSVMVHFCHRGIPSNPPWA